MVEPRSRSFACELDFVRAHAMSFLSPHHHGRFIIRGSRCLVPCCIGVRLHLSWGRDGLVDSKDLWRWLWACVGSGAKDLWTDRRDSQLRVHRLAVGRSFLSFVCRDIDGPQRWGRHGALECWSLHDFGQGDRRIMEADRLESASFGRSSRRVDQAIRWGRLGAWSDRASDPEARALFGSDGFGPKRCDTLRLYRHKFMGQGLANLEFSHPDPHDDSAFGDPCDRDLGDRLRVAQASVIDPSGDASSDLPDRHDKALRARRPDRLGRCGGDIAFESLDDLSLPWLLP